MERFHPRLLGPLALGAALIAVLIVVMASTGGDEPASTQESATTGTGTSTAKRSGTTPRTQTTPPSAATTATTETTPGADAETYTVRPGDTPGSISQRTGVPVEEILELNPDVEPNALTVGDEIRLRE